MDTKSLRKAVTFLFLAVLISACSFAADSAYRQSVEKWRQEYHATLISDSGWLTVSGLFWLKEGDNRFGSASTNDIVLPASAPSSVGVLTLHSGKITARINPGLDVTLDGKPVQTAELRPDAREDQLTLGDLTLYVHASGNRLALRLKDRNSVLRKNFRGLHWFPIDESYAVTGNYIPYESPRVFDSQNVLGDAIKLTITGYVTFSLKGQEYRLEAGSTNSEKSLFIIFRDLTSGKETYPASRFLEAPTPIDGNSGPVLLDFNEAYNPPCAYNPFTTCPIPLSANRLKVAIPAGEKLYKLDHGT